MIARMGSGWQTVLADLSMILFMVTAAGVATSPPDPLPSPEEIRVPAVGDPVALWRGGAGAPALDRWLAEQSPDPRLRLTIVAPLDEERAALALAAQAGRPARVLLEPQGSGPPIATLTYDLGETARPLPVSGPDPIAKGR